MTKIRVFPKNDKGKIIGELWLVKITEIFRELWEELDG
nr:MAG TPA: TFIIF beta initiation factor IIF, beta subunit [Caudoviricetes sp.]